MFIKRFLYLFSLALLSLLIITCGSSSSEIDKNAIFVNVGEEPQTMDPSLNSSIEASMYIFHAFEGLAGRDQSNNIVPLAAESWDISDDYLTYTFYLKTNALWSDGKPVVASDFIYAWSRVVDPKTGASYSYQMEPLKNAKAITAGELPLSELGVKAIDDYTLEVTLEAPTPYFLELMAYTIFYPLRSDIIEANPDTWSMNPETYIGNGPFKMIERKIDDKIVMAKNEHYWNIDEIIPENLVFVLMRNAVGSVAGVKGGTLHFSTIFPSQDIPELEKEDLIEINPYLGTYYYEFNFTNEVLKNADVRRALSLVIDRKYIVDSITKAGQIPAGAFVPHGITDYDGKDFRENAGNYFSVDPVDYEKNIAEAKALLAKAGYPNGKGMPVLELKANPGHERIFEAVQQMWKENLGVDSTIGLEEWAVFQQTRLDKNYSLSRYSWIGDYDDPITFLGLFLSRSPQNVSSYSNAQYDKLLDVAMSTGNQKIRMDALHKAEKILIDDMAFIPFYFMTQPVILDPKLKGVQYSSLGKHKFFYAYLEE